MANAADTIAHAITKNSQDVVLSTTYRAGANKFRITIKSNAYDFQSFARVEVWSPVTFSWNELHSIPYAAMQTEKGLCYRSDKIALQPGNFAHDVVTLSRVAVAIMKG